ncbi:MAG: response regulator [Desulfomonile sp.]|nr:response regulator [Desulfomonile sp.]
MAHVLVVDEDTDSRFLLKRLLELGGHSVVSVSDHDQAIEAAKLGDPDLAIIHLKAGSLWSRRLPALLKAGNERLKIMTIADYVPDQITDIALGDDFLAKPVDLETIESRVRALLGCPSTERSRG